MTTGSLRAPGDLLRRKLAEIEKRAADLRASQEKSLRDAFILSPRDQKAVRRRALRLGYAPVCSYCGQPSGEMESDHIVAKALGGPNGSHNRTPACRPCNQRKGDKPFLIWLLEIGARHEA